MRRRIVNATMLCLAALGLAFVLPAAAFALVAPLTLPQLVAEADAIVEARVVSAHARQAPSASGSARKPIYTDTTLRVGKLLKGARPERFVISQIGGRIGSLELRVSDVPRFVSGERAIIFLRDGTVVGGEQGVLAVVDGEVPALGLSLREAEALIRSLDRSRGPLAFGSSAGSADSSVESFGTLVTKDAEAASGYSSAAVPIISSINPTEVDAGIGDRIRIEGSGFGTAAGKVEFVRGDGDSTPALGGIVSWSSGVIECTVPSPAQSGPVAIRTATGSRSSGASLRVGFSWSGRKSSSGFSYRINENTSDVSGEGAAIRRALATWGKAGAKYSFTVAGSTSASSAFPKQSDGANEIYFASFPSDYQDYLAINQYWISGSTIVESDIFFNDNYFQWADGAFPNTQDVESAALHELGHTIGLDDQYGDWQYDEVMGAAYTGHTRRTLSPEETEGIRHIYGSSDVSPPSTPTITSSTHSSDAWSTNSTPRFDFQSTDDSGVTGYAYKIDRVSGTTPGTAAVAQAFATYTLGTDDGEWWFHVRARDAAGNWSATAHRRIRVDCTPPVTASDAVPLYTMGASITLQPTDTRTSVASTSWVLDGEAGTGTTVSTSEVGSHTLSFASVDVLGNREEPRTVTFAVTDPPVADPVADGSGVYVAVGTGASVTVTASAEPGVVSLATVGFSTVTDPGRLTLARGTFTTPYGWRTFGRSWHLAFSGASGPTLSVTLPYDPLLTPGRVAGLRVLEWDGQLWQQRAPSRNTAARTLTVVLDAARPIGPLVVAEPSSVSRASKLTLHSASQLKPEYGDEAYVVVKLVDASAVPLSGRALKLYRSDGSVAATLKPSTKTAGVYRGYAPVVRSRTVFSAKFAGDSANSASTLSVTVVPKAKLSVNAPESPKPYRSFGVSGGISPAHSDAVVYFEAWRKNSKGDYYRYKRVKATTSSGSFSKTFSLPAGRYRFRTTHSDHTHTSSVSRWDYITVGN